MSLLNDIKLAQLRARKEKNSLVSPVVASILTTLIGEAEMVGKNAGNRETTDEEVQKVIVKFIKGIDEVLPHLEAESEQWCKYMAERAVLSMYLPKQLTKEDLKSIIISKFPEKVSTGEVMKFLKENYNNQYDGKVASSLISEVW